MSPDDPTPPPLPDPDTDRAVADSKARLWWATMNDPNAWQKLIGAYLKLRLDMQEPEIIEVLGKCEKEVSTRAQYLKLAKEALPWWQYPP